MLRGGKMLKVGDKVKVREGLENVTTPVIVRESMIKLEGKEVEVLWVRVNSVDGITRYKVKEDLGGWLWTEEMFEKIEEKESNNMKIKEMTLNEILDSIFEGKLEMEEFNKQFETFCCEKVELLTKQFKRPQYTFQEAFKAFEEGKEIESCESGFKFKRYEDTVRIKGGCYKVLYECLKVKIFSTEEIQGKWYIND